MDDTNPGAERHEYEEAIIEDATWLGAHFDARIRYASEHFEDLLDLAWKMIEHGEAYVDTSPKDVLSAMRGTFTTAGVASVDRDAPIAVHRERFSKLLRGEIGPGEAVLRARMDLAHPNLVLRDPVLWRGLHTPHPRLAGWVSFPTYDFAHPFCDLRDGVTLSLCSLEFEDRRPLYDHVVELAIHHGFALDERPAPRELEFARLEPSVGMTSKRVLREAIERGGMNGWDDPRLLTLRGLRAKGYTPEMVCAFVRRLGVSRSAGVAPMEWTDEEVRNIIGNTPARLVVMDPVPLDLTGNIPTHMKLPDDREMKASAHLWVGRYDVRAIEEPGFRRLCPGKMVRLMGLGGFAHVDRVICNEGGRIERVEASYHEEGKAKATVHVLPREDADRVDVTCVETWDGEGDPALCWKRTSAMMEPGCPSGIPLHAPRVGWGWRVSDTEWRLLAGMVAR
jgi:glutaminyl-tRNA synthetase